MTAMSWKRRMEKEACPPLVRRRFFSLSDWSTIAVEDIAAMSPTVSATCQRIPKTSALAPTTSGRGHDLPAAEPEDFAARLPEQRGPQLQADEEKHHDHAELGEVHHPAGLAHEPERIRPDDHAGDEISEDGAEAEALSQRDGDDRGEQINEGFEKAHGVAEFKMGAPARAR